MNCDFSSNNNIWARLGVFVAAILNFVGLFLLWQIDLNFVYEFFVSHSELEFWTSNFRLQISEIPTEHLDF